MKINRIIINNFLSIGTLDLTLNDGLYELIGYNHDVTVNGQATSNGSGKSAVTLAILQCLYNRNPKVNTMESCNNTVTKSPYNITLHLTTIDGVQFTVINDRATMSIKVYNVTTNTLLSTRIKESLTLIEELIGLSYDEFTTLSLITQDTISSIFSTDTNLILRYFDLTMIETYLARAKKQRQLINSNIKLTRLRLSDITKMVSIIDTHSVQKELTELNDKLSVLSATHPYALSKDKLEDSVRSSRSRLDSMTYTIKSLEENLSISKLGKCPTCKQDVTEIDTSNILSQLADTRSEFELISSNLIATEGKLSELSEDFNNKKQEITESVRLLESKLVTQQHVTEASTDDIDELQLELIKLEKELNIIKSLITLMDSGKVTTAYLHSFMVALNLNISTTVCNIGSTFNIVASISKGKIKFEVTDDNIIKDIDMLSGGEHTIIALIILLGIYNTLQEQLNVSLPILVIDEALNRIDTLNINVVNDLINLLKVNKTVIVIQHHNELPSSTFDGSIVVNKVNGVTT